MAEDECREGEQRGEETTEHVHYGSRGEFLEEGEDMNNMESEGTGGLARHRMNRNNAYCHICLTMPQRSPVHQLLREDNLKCIYWII